MPRPYDVTTKDLLQRDPASWLGYLRLETGGPVQVIDADVSTVPAEADLVYRVGGPRRHLVHIEAQSRPDGRLPRRLWRYNALLDLKYELRVQSVALLLRPEADSKAFTGVLDLHLPGGAPLLTFHYQVIRCWEQPVEPLLTGPLTTLPMAALADVPTEDVPAVLERIDSRLFAETSPDTAARIMASTMILAGMRVDFNTIDKLARKLLTMDPLKESPTYPLVMKMLENWVNWHVRVGEARKILIRMGRIRFGPLPRAIRPTLMAINDPERLERLAERVLTATSWKDLLADGE